MDRIAKKTELVSGLDAEITRKEQDLENLTVQYNEDRNRRQEELDVLKLQKEALTKLKD